MTNYEKLLIGQMSITSEQMAVLSHTYQQLREQLKELVNEYYANGATPKALTEFMEATEMIIIQGRLVSAQYKIIARELYAMDLEVRNPFIY